jgi:hypothetical protein
MLYPCTRLRCIYWTALPYYFAVLLLNPCFAQIPTSPGIKTPVEPDTSTVIRLMCHTWAGDIISDADWQLNKPPNCRAKGKTAYDTTIIQSCNGPGNVTLEVIKNDDASLSGVDAFDLADLQKHLFGVQALKTPLAILAADVNASGTLTALDAKGVSDVLLGKHTRYPQWPDRTWHFIRKDYTFPNPANPWQGMPTGDPGFIKNLARQTFSISKVDFDSRFYGVKIGDVNHSIFRLPLLAAQPAVVHYVPATAEAGQSAEIPVFLKEARDGAAWQMTLRYDTTRIRLKNIRWARQGDVSWQQAWHEPKPGEVRLLWFDMHTHRWNADDPLFYIEVQMLRKGNTGTIRISDGLLPRWFAADGTGHRLTTEPYHVWKPPASASRTGRSAVTLSLYPNPTSGICRLQILAPEICDAEILICDMLERTLFRHFVDRLPPDGNIVLKETAELAPGQYLLKVRTPFDRQVLRLVRQ